MVLEQTIHLFLKARPIAVIGVSRDPEKYGYKVYRTLKEKGLKVYGVNPWASEVDGDPLYPDLHSLPEAPQAIVIVVPPDVTRSVVEQALQAGIQLIWMQPGSEHPEAIEKAEQMGATVVHGGPCIIVVAKTHLP